SVRRKLEGRDARCADSILYRDETSAVPVQAIDAGECCMRTGRDIDARRIRQIVLDHSKRVRDVQCAIVVGQRNSVWIVEGAMKLQGHKFVCGRIEAKHGMAYTVGRKNITRFANNEIVESVTCLV